MKNRTELVTVLVSVITVIVGITVAYAALSTTLTITSNQVAQSALTWNVGFVPGSVTATVGGTSDTGRTCGTATANASTVTVADTTLSKPGDSCTYALTVKNSGTIDAQLTSISPTAPSGTGVTCGTQSNGTLICGNITYMLTSDANGTTPLATGTTLAKNNATQPVYLVIKYNADTLASTAVTQTGAAFSLVYSQN